MSIEVVFTEGETLGVKGKGTARTLQFWLRPAQFKWSYSANAWELEEYSLEHLQMILRVCRDKGVSFTFDPQVKAKFIELKQQRKDLGTYKRNGLPYSEKLYELNDMVCAMDKKCFKATYRKMGVVLYMYEGMLAVRGSAARSISEGLCQLGFEEKKEILSWCLKKFNPDHVEAVKSLCEDHEGDGPYYHGCSEELLEYTKPTWMHYEEQLDAQEWSAPPSDDSCYNQEPCYGYDDYEYGDYSASRSPVNSNKRDRAKSEISPKSKPKKRKVSAPKARIVW